MLNDNNYELAEQDIEFVRSKLHILTQNPELGQLLGEDFAKSLLEWEQRIAKKCDEPFTLVILGDFKRGKSTIINALLGKELAPVNVTPETYTINEISYGETPSVEAVLLDGTRIPLSLDQITREKIEPLMATFKSKVDYLDIRDNAPILKEMRIVDTPGLSDLDDLDRQVEGYLVNADAIIYVASALLPFSESEQMFLLSHIQPQRFGMLYVLVNMIDAMQTKADVDKIMKRIVERSEAVVPNAVVFGISGADELRRKTNMPRIEGKDFADFYENEFLKFEVSLKRDIIMQKDVIRRKRVLSMLWQMLEQVSAHTRMFGEMATLDRLKLEEISKQFEEECQYLETALENKKPIIHLNIVEMQQEAERWMYEFFAKLRESVLECRPDESGQSDITAGDVQKYFYSFLMDKVGEAYRTCLDAHKDKINEIVDDMSQQLAKKLGLANLSEISRSTSVDRLMSELKRKVTRSVMDVKQFGTSETFPAGTMSSFKDIMKKKSYVEIIDITLENYNDIRNNTVKDMQKAYEFLEKEAVQRLDDIYSYQEKLGRETIAQARDMVSRYDNDKITSIISDAYDVLASASEVMEKYGLSNEEEE